MGCGQLTALTSVAVLVSGRIRAIKVRILAAHEATVLVV